MWLCVPEPVCQTDSGNCVVELADGHPQGRFGDDTGSRCIEPAQTGIDLCGGALDARHGVDQRQRHALPPGSADGEQPPAALGLGAPQGICRHLHRAQTVVFRAGVHAGSSSVARRSRRTKGRMPPWRW
jgi:hypothetical protein